MASECILFSASQKQEEREAEVAPMTAGDSDGLPVDSGDCLGENLGHVHPNLPAHRSIASRLSQRF